MSNEYNQTRGPLPRPANMTVEPASGERPVPLSKPFNIVGVPRHTIEGLRSTLALDVYQRLLLDEAAYAKQTVQQVLVGVLTRHPHMPSGELADLAEKTVHAAMHAFGSVVAEYGVRDR